MKNKIIKVSIAYYSFCVILSVVHFTKARFEPPQTEKIVLKDTIKANNKTFKK